MLRFGLGKSPQEPLKRSGVNTSDARILTNIHAYAAVMPYVWPLGEELFLTTISYRGTNATIGFEESLFTKCGDVEDAFSWSSDVE